MQKLFLGVSFFLIAAKLSAIEIHFVNQSEDGAMTWTAPRGTRIGVSRKTQYYRYSNVRLSYTLESVNSEKVTGCLKLPETYEGKAIVAIDLQALTDPLSLPKLKIKIEANEDLGDSPLYRKTREKVLFELNPTNNDDKFIIAFEGLNLTRDLDDFMTQTQHISSSNDTSLTDK